MKWFIAIVSIVDILGYIITLVGSFFAKPPGLASTAFLGINPNTLKLWERDPVEIVKHY